LKTLAAGRLAGFSVSLACAIAAGVLNLCRRALRAFAGAFIFSTALQGRLYFFKDMSRAGRGLFKSQLAALDFAKWRPVGTR